MKVEITARIDRGFDMISDEWIGYKRNYFTLVAAYNFPEYPLDITAESKFFCLDSKRTKRQLAYFMLRLRAVSAEDGTTDVRLVQHTAKRDRGPQFSPPIYNSVPGALPSHEIMRQVANIRNDEKVSESNRVFNVLPKERAVLAENENCIIHTYPPEEPLARVARYERIQFSSVASTTKKSGTSACKYNILVVDLLGRTVNGNLVVLASANSPPLTIRSRSPSNYRVDSEAPGNSNKASVPKRLGEKSNDKENESWKDTKKTRKKGKRKISTGRAKRKPLSVINNAKNKVVTLSVHPNSLREIRRANRANYHRVQPARQSLNPNIPGLSFFEEVLETSALAQQLSGEFTEGDEHTQEAIEEEQDSSELNTQTRTSGQNENGSEFSGTPNSVGPSVNSLDLNISTIIGPRSENSQIMEQLCPLAIIENEAESSSHSSDHEALNVLHSEFRSPSIQSPSSFFKLAQAEAEYERARAELDQIFEQINQKGLMSSARTLRSSDVTFRTSTPSLIRNTSARLQGKAPKGWQRCKHGYKKRSSFEKRRHYIISDLRPENYDVSFTAFLLAHERIKMALARDKYWSHNIPLSPLTFFGPEEEELQFRLFW